LNLARTEPKIVASWIKNRYLEKGTKGIKGDESCYQEAFDFLMAAPATTLITEDAGIDLAAYTHAKDQIDTNSFSHDTSDKTTPTARLQKFGSFAGSWGMTQVVALFQRSTAVPANDVIMLFACDCGIKTRKHRVVLFDKSYSRAGVGVSNKERNTMFTLVFAKGFTRAPITNEQLAAANIEGNGLYTGAGASFDTATFKKQGVAVNAGPQIHSKQAIENFDDSTGELGTLASDNSVECPEQINHEILEIRTVRAWTRTSQSCTRNTAPFTTADNLDRVKPFAQKGKCYHRFRFCSAKGAVWTYDREYKTKSQVNTPTKDISNELGDALGDVTIACPTWISPKLRIRIVNNWFVLSKLSCKRGTNYGANGLKRDPPLAKKGKCYHRQYFCDEANRVWAKDSEYYTLAQWSSLKRK